ncbi:hypothetical protein ASPVEDRAFT_123327 [Aspergillus versicolor CBS 583.65]|uniref:Luciferase domain-containing protein n=1 Tax=Aspergillus versicolor CBS 583.65 TaxID=1036611 RepID=A0A1L9PD65_ASPVE|nr:uncharacterized protein ASPVEDRAFT_123327 [Aspergillus versicolor CBS 583.65]OJI99477.1 hypothetical protein ASPVEDRAFT_123327 [Aspergillus versicolor CBS 583.65]
MSYFSTVAEKAHSLVTQSPFSHRSRLLLAALPAALIALLLPAYRDYQSWLLLGPGGPPYNVFGWLLVKLLFDPLRREPFGTVLYDGKIESGEQAAFLSSLPHRKGQRPTMGEFTVPQRQISQRPSAEVRDKLMAAYGAFLERNAHIVDRVPSILERHTDAAHVCGHVPLTSVARQMKREICHVHGTSDYSLHVTLAPADCKRVIESGWGQRFPLAGSSVFRNVTFGRVSTIPTEYVLIYAPRDEEEIEVVIGILKAGVQYVTGLSDVK